MGLKDRLLKFIDNESITVQEFEKRTGMSNGSVSKMGDNTRVSTLDKIVVAFPQLDIVWLRTGEGEMLKSTSSDEAGASSDSSSDSAYLVPLLPISAQGGSLNDFVVSVKDSDCERIVSPIRGADYALTVSGDSMAPEYPSGSQILVKRINERAFIDWGRVYVLDTCNGTVIKKLFPSESPDAVTCKSVNPDYPPFNVAYEDIYGVYRVLMCMSLK